ncbi:hypothetical protein F4811DRAFT_570391 [Daldinia bambusicola]|nr:hypothetical protein F4811DRAFT_570391 [Daldinia bambusicola]
MSHNNNYQIVSRTNNPFSLLDADNATDSTNYPAIEARKIMSDEEQRSAGGPLVAPWAGYIANGRMTRTLSQLWIESGESVPAFMERLFEVEYVGLELRAFEGLPAWAVPLPEDFDEEKHIGWATHKYVLERRLHICIEIDPSPKQAWLKPVLDATMENWIRDSRKRLYGVNKLWEAYDFLCHWALDIARTRITCPVLYALDNYTQDSIRNLRLSVSESVKMYEELVGSDRALSISEDSIKSYDKGREIATADVRSVIKENALDEDGEDNTGSRRVEPYVSKGRGPRSSNLSIRYQPWSTWAAPSSFSSSASPAISTPRQQLVFTRRRPVKPEREPTTPPNQAQDQAATPTATPIPVPDSILAPAPQITAPRPKSPEDAVAQMAEATRAGVRADSFKAWSHFFSAQLALQYNHHAASQPQPQPNHPQTPPPETPSPNPDPSSDSSSGSGSGSSSGWPSSIDEAFQLFLRELCERFPGGEHAAGLREWVRGASRRVEAYKAEREERARVDELLRRALDGRKEKE